MYKLFKPEYAAKKIKASEKNRINPAYTNISQGQTFKAIEGVTYLWLYTDKMEVIMGIDKPWHYPEAFKVNNDAEWQRIAAQLREGAQSNNKLEPIGHPTLACTFEPTGAAKSEEGKAYLGGELRYDNSKDQWVLSNKSGRFGRAKETDAFIIDKSKKILYEVGREISHHNKIKIDIYYRHNKVETFLASIDAVDYVHANRA